MPIAHFTGAVIGRNHDPLPIEITGIALPYKIIRNVRVTCLCPALTPSEIAFYFDELPKDDFTIGQQVVLTIEHRPDPAQLSVEATAEPQAEPEPEAPVVIPPPPEPPAEEAPVA